MPSKIIEKLTEEESKKKKISSNQDNTPVKKQRTIELFFKAAPKPTLSKDVPKSNVTLIYDSEDCKTHHDQKKTRHHQNVEDEDKSCITDSKEETSESGRKENHQLSKTDIQKQDDTHENEARNNSLFSLGDTISLPKPTERKSDESKETVSKDSRKNPDDGCNNSLSDITMNDENSTAGEQGMQTKDGIEKKCRTKKLRCNEVPVDNSTNIQKKTFLGLKDREKYAKLQKKCLVKITEVIENIKDDALLKNIDLRQIIQQVPKLDTTKGDFPDILCPVLACIIEGSSLSLSKLSAKAHKVLLALAPRLDINDIKLKILVLSKRRAYLSLRSQNVCHEEEVKEKMYRWELESLEFLSNNKEQKKIIATAKCLRTERKRLRTWFVLASNIQRNVTRLFEAATENLHENALAQVKKEEQKLIKFEQEEEKKALVQLAKEKKEIEKEKVFKEKELLKQKKDKERELEKKKKDEEKEKVKIEKQRMKEEKQREKEQKLEKERKEQERKSNENKKRMLSFFPKASPSVEPSTAEVETRKKEEKVVDNPNSFDLALFRSSINATASICKPLFPSLSSSAKNSRKKRCKTVDVTVEADVLEPQPCIELRVINVPNKFKLLKFYEDTRPPYCGTWSKTSSIITGSNPFGKDTTVLDYDYDSEAEWEDEASDAENLEEIIDEEEDLQLEEESGQMHDSRIYNFEDGWLMHDEDAQKMQSYDEDDSSNALRKQPKNTDAIGDQLLLIAPCFGGLPPFSSTADVVVEGCKIDEAQQIKAKIKGHLLNETEKDICVTLFPPSITVSNSPPMNEKLDEKSRNLTQKPPQTKSTGNSGLKQQRELRTEERIVLARYVHNNDCKKRDQLIEELMKKFSDRKEITRSLVYRTFITMAEKKKHPERPGVFWEVKEEILLELGLKELVGITPKEKPSQASTPKKNQEDSGKSNPSSTKKKYVEDEKKSKAKKRVLEEEKKSKASQPSKASVNLFSGYFKKAKTETKNESY